MAIGLPSHFSGYNRTIRIMICPRKNLLELRGHFFDGIFAAFHCAVLATMTLCFFSQSWSRFGIINAAVAPRLSLRARALW